MKLRCLIIDDEPLAQRVLEKYIAELSGLELVGKCGDALEAMDVLKKEEIDLIFLDINMPRLNGINFLKTYKNPPLTIITSAYTEYAVESYELNVLDYLKKPFAFQRFLQAIQKAEERLKKVDQQEEVKGDMEYIFVKANKKTINVSLDSIQYIEALGDYVKIYTDSEHIVTYQSLKGIEKLLPTQKFYRVHKSYIVALAKIKSIEGNMVHMSNNSLPIGNNYKQGFLQKIHMN
ncbi:LytTR family DNA-binding domain-containing protein [Ancylomarina sp. DW003]|nr:LytTR family DNA-binding domain-containing protein [Ancylomarina sp. DW003]MDE5423097.1 LytTR family DNA-binding domain-containing protein [Ancylomarina sp. DW003]